MGSVAETSMIDEQAGSPGDPCVMVLYGGSGDLTKRKLIPALYNLAKDTLLPQQFAIVGSARRPMTHETFRLQPQEGISLRFGAKVPGPLVRLGPVNMEFRYADSFGTTPSTGYERLLYNGMMGDAILFQRADMVEAAWAVVAPILDVWKVLPPRHFPNYAAGTWGPKAADELIGRDGRQWRRSE